MSTNFADHPDPSQLSAFVLGKLELAEVDAVESHLASCETCCDALRQIKEDTFVGLVRDAQDKPADPGPATLGAMATLPPAGESPADNADRTEADRADVVSTKFNLPAGLAQHARYRVVELIGSGGMGSVYKAEHTLMQRTVALKVINPKLVASKSAVERFRREVQAAARLDHPNIVRAYDAEQAGDSHFLVMEYVHGTDLHKVVEERGPLPVAEACDYIRQAALGLQHAHESGMVHRDIKPQNLMIADCGLRIAELKDTSAECGIRNAELKDRPSIGEAPARIPASKSAIRNPQSAIVKILDFGFASLVVDPDAENATINPQSPIPNPQSQLTEAGSIMGTPDYMAPEQGRDARKADIRSDIYSLGCTLYYLLTGKVPFPGGTAIDKIIAHSEHKLPAVNESRKDIPVALVKVLDKMMAKDAAQRYQSPAEVAAALAPFSRDATADRGGRTRNRNRRGIAVALAALSVLMFGIIYVATDKGRLRIESNVDDVQVVVSKNGQEVEVIDLKSGSTVKRLPSGDYDIKLKGDRTDVKLDKSGFTLSRWGSTIVKVTEDRSLANATGMSPEVIAAIRPELLLVVRAAQGKLSEGERQKLTAQNHPVLGQLQDPPTRKILEMFAALPAIAQERLREEGYLKWKFSSLDADRQEVYRSALQANLDGIKKQGLAVPATMSLAALEKSEVGFAVVSIPETNQHVISWYILLPEHPQPIWVTLVGAKAIGTPAYLNAHNQQLPRLKSRPERVDWKSLVAQEQTRIEQIDAATAAAKDWLRLFDAGQYADAWEQSSELSRKAMGKDATIRTYQQVGRQLGKLHSRDLHNRQYETSLPNLPSGEYVVVDFESSFENLKNATETLIVVLDKDRKWRPLFYSALLRQVDGNGDTPNTAAKNPHQRTALAAKAAFDALLAREKDPSADREQLRADVTDFKWKHSGLPESIAAAELLNRLPSPLDRLDAAQIPPVHRDEKLKGLVAVLLGHEGKNYGVICLHFLADGKLLASAGEDGTIRLWDLTGPSPVQTAVFKKHTGTVWSMAASPDGTLLASGGGDNIVCLWDVAAKGAKEPAVIDGYTSGITGLAFSPDGQTLASGSWDKARGGIVRLIEVSGSSWKEQRVLTGHSGLVQGVAFAPDGKSLASGSLDGTVRIWDLTGANRPPTILRHPDWVYPVMFSPDGKVLGSVCKDDKMRLWDMTKSPPELRVELPAKGGHVFSPNGRLLFTGDQDGKIYVWDGALPRQSGFVGLGRGKKLEEWKVPSVTSIAVAPDSRHVAVGRPDGPIHIVRMTPPPDSTLPAATLNLTPPTVMDHMVGVWNTETIYKPDPAKPATAALGRAVIERIAGGRFHRLYLTGQAGGSAALTIRTFDKDKWEFREWNFSPDGTVVYPSFGRFDAATNTLTVTGPARDGRQAVKQHRWIDSNTIVGNLTIRDKEGKVIFDGQMNLKRQPPGNALSEIPVDAGQLPKEMAILDRLEGDWDMNWAVRSDPNDKRQAEMTARKILGGRFIEVRERVVPTGEENCFIYTYDAKQKKFRAWHFSSRWSVGAGVGVWNEAARTLTWTYETEGHQGPRIQTTWKMTSADKIDFGVLVQEQDGKLVTDLVGTQQRRTKALPAGAKRPINQSSPKLAITDNPRWLRDIDHGSQIRSLGFAADGKSVVVAGNDLAVFDASTGEATYRKKLTASDDFVVTPLSFSTERKAVAFAHPGKVVVIHIDKPERVKEISIQSTYSVALSPDAGIVVYAADGALVFHDLKTDKTERKPSGPASGLRFSPDGRYFVSIAARKLTVMDQKTFGVFANELDVGNQGLTDISSDSKRLVANAVTDGKPGFRVFQLEGLKIIHEELNLPGVAVSFSFSPGGDYLAIGLLNGTVQIWDLSQKKLAASWVPHESRNLMYTPVAFSPDGKTLATGGRNMVKLWDLTASK